MTAIKLLEEARPKLPHTGDCVVRMHRNNEPCSCLLARIDALLATGGWMPIESVPKDDLIDIWIPRSNGEGVRWADCYYDHICDQWRTSSPSGHLVTVRATAVSYWRPRPAAPNIPPLPEAK